MTLGRTFWLDRCGELLENVPKGPSPGYSKDSRGRKMNRVFMPGRFCVFGEHSDWASEYKALNPDIEKGYALVIGLEEGIFLEAEKSTFFTYEYEKRIIELSREEFVQRSEKVFFEYVISAAKIMLQEYGVFGIHITCTKNTLPIKKRISIKCGNLHGGYTSI